ncbi:MAG: hypothetical protein KDL87_05565 [Verrucomicrobiae bacterium]|nr:hypothetical protein [Verrucomicrobiae bacterium]
MRPLLLSILCVTALGDSLPAAEPFRPNLGPDLPQFTVTCGKVTLMMRQASQWTPGRVDYLGAPMTTERSAYGTVFSFPDVGFIGTAHLENEPETLTSLSFFLDDQPVATPAAELKGRSWRSVRESKIRSFVLKGEIELKDDRLFETTTVTAESATPLKLVYHFMHAWTPTVSAFLAGSDADPAATMGEPLRDADDVKRKFYIQKTVDWMAVYEPVSGQFAVSRLLEAPEAAGNVSMIWNVPGTYRKYYLRCFNNQTVPAGFTGRWRMVTAFGKADAGAWEGPAKALAEELKALK